MFIDEERVLWREGDHECVLISCCTGAELQVRTVASGTKSAEVVLRELYPTKSDLYERARALELDYHERGIRLPDHRSSGEGG